MSERPDEIAARIAGVQKLGSVVGAMRGIAAARARQAGTQLAAVDTYAATIRDALRRVLTLLPGPLPQRDPPRRVLVAFVAEQGFAGAFSERVLDRIGDPPDRLVLVGTRGGSVAASRGLLPWHQVSMPSHLPAIPRLADGLAGKLLEGLDDGRSIEVEALFTVSQPVGFSVERRRIFPTDLPEASDNIPPPLVNLPPVMLLSELMAEALHADLCRAALHAAAAENTARMLAMAAAQGQIDERLAALQARQRSIRQETITAEIVELASGEAAFRETLARRKAG